MTVEKKEKKMAVFEEFSKCEEMILNLFWESKEGLTIADIENSLLSQKISKVTIFKAVQKMLDLEYLEVCGLEKATKTYARKFKPTVTKEEYAAQVLMSKGVSTKNIGNVVVAMLGNGQGKRDKRTTEKAIKELEGIIDSIRAEGK